MPDFPEKDPQSVALSVRIYWLLLAVYPAAFRQMYGSDMLQVFRDCCLNALHRTGMPGLLTLWGETFADVLRSALEQNLHRNVHISQAQWIRMSGWCLSLGGVYLGVAVQVTYLNAAGTAQGSPLSVPVHTLYRAQAYLLPGAWLLITLGIAGMLARYGVQAGRLGKGLLRLSLFGGTAACLSAAAVQTLGWSPWWAAGWMAGNLLFFTSLAFFGVLASKPDHSNTNFLPRWNAVPLLLCLVFPFLGLFAWAGLLVGQGITWSVGVSLVLLGYTLQSNPAATPAGLQKAPDA
jgi:hypothetical protein